MTLKGGAELRIFPSSAPPNETSRRLRDWAALVLGPGDAPSAFLAIAFRVEADNPGALYVRGAWWSDSYALPLSLLPEFGLAAVRSEMTIATSEEVVMRNLGYRPVDPDDAS